MPRSITQVAISGTATLIAEISIRAPLAPTVSMSQAALSTMRRACSILMRLSAIQFWTTPCSASVLPKATRCVARSHMTSNARSAIPMRRMQ